ncbi:MAG: glycine cleavage system protein GcvH [Chthonomonadaceae bacterium]|nr:glycine cleavage system protein GcvH [Chthonomonadaceae bacterium]
MANVPDNLKYSKTHEWVSIEGEIATIGITDHAQEEMGDIVYLSLPDIGRTLAFDEQFGEVESVKAVSELFSPLTGEVIETNTAIGNTTEIVNEDPYGNGWLMKIKLSNPSEMTDLLDAASYTQFAEEGGH